jgi:iron(III) transport system permease protein
MNRWSFFNYILTFIIVLPIAFVINHALGSETQTLVHLKETILSEYISSTLILVFAVGFLSLILGIGTAYLTTFYQFRFVGFFVFALALPFAIPTYIMGYIYSDIFGYFNHFHIFVRSLGIKEYFNVLNIYSVILIMSLALYPYVYLLVKASFEKSKSALLNPALSLGSSRKKVFLKIILPLSRPAIVGSLALVMMETISEYGITEYYNIKTLTPAIFNTWFGLHDSKSATYLAVMAMLMVLIVLAIEKYNRGKASYKIENSNAEVEKQQLKGYKLYLTYFFLSLPVIFGFLIPLIWIGVYSYEYAAKFLDDKFLTILTNSFTTSMLTAFIIMVLAFFVAYTSRIFPTALNKYLSKIISLGFTMPGAVIAIGIIMLFTDIDKWLIENYITKTLFLSGSFFTLLFAYMVRFFAIGVNTVDSSFERISIDLNKASRSLGYSYFKTLFKVELPLMKNALFFGFILVFISTIKELPLTLVLRPFNYDTLATKAYVLANAQMLHETAIYALGIIVISLIPLTIIILKRQV